MAPSVKFMPRSLTQPGGAVFLDPAHRVSREELDRRDARWRALRERAYARAWSDDATLVGSYQHYAASVLRDFDERTLGRSASSTTRRLTHGGEETSTLNHQPRSIREGSMRRSNATPASGGFSSMMLSGSRRNRRFRNTVRRWLSARV
jgi:hypothetical protein